MRRATAGPSGADRLFLRREPGRSLLYDRARHDYFELSDDEAWLLADAQDLPLKDAVARLEKRRGAGTARRVMDELAELGSPAELFGERVRTIKLPRVPGARAAPLTAHLGVTAACNFACAHCYSSSGKRAAGELHTREIESVIDQLDAMGCRKLVLGGGEPFLRHDLPRLIGHAHGRGVDCYVHTNGASLSRAGLEELARCPPVALAVSLDGADARTNDAIRGAAAFERALRGIRALRDHYPPGFNISMSVTPLNAAEAPRLVKLAKRLGAGVLLLRPTYPAGEALGAQELACDRRTFAVAARSSREMGRKLGLEVNAPDADRTAPPDFEGFGCVAGRLVLGIDPVGNVTPCLNLPREFVAGNVREHGLAHLWRKGRTFLDLRRQAPCDECRRCPELAVCRGGCRVRALAAGRGLGGPDTWCRHEREPAGRSRATRRAR